MRWCDFNVWRSIPHVAKWHPWRKPLSAHDGTPKVGPPQSDELNKHRETVPKNNRLLTMHPLLLSILVALKLIFYFSLEELCGIFWCIKKFVGAPCLVCLVNFLAGSQMLWMKKMHCLLLLHQDVDHS